MTRTASRGLSVEAALLAAVSALGQLAMVVAFAVIGRSQGPAVLGEVTVSLAVATIGASLVDFGANSYWVRELAAMRMTADQFCERAATKTIVGLMLGFVFTLFPLLSPELRGYWYAGPLLAISVIVETIRVPVRAMQWNRLLSGLILSEKVAMLGIFLLLAMYVHLSPRVAFVFSYVLGGLLSTAIANFMIRDHYRAWLPLANLADVWRGSRYYGLSRMLLSMAGLDTIIGTAVGGSAVAGTYGAVNRWTSPIGLATNAFETLLAPEIAAAKDRKDVWERIRPTLWLPAASVGIAFLMALLADVLVVFVMGSGFSASVNVLRVLCIGAALGTVNQSIQVVVQSRGRDRQATRVLTWGICAQLAVVAPLTSRFGALGLALAFLLSQIVLLTGFVVILRRIQLRAGGTR